MENLSSDQEKKALFSRRIFSISDYELSNESLKLFDKKGFIKKQMVLVKEIPVYEITDVESYWNELSVTWNGITNLFFRKDSFESFSDLRDKILVLIEERRKTLEYGERARLRTIDLKSIIDTSTPIVDFLFDILINLNEKRVNWKRLEGHSSNFTKNLNLVLQTLSPLILDYSKISSAINKQSLKETSEETCSILKSIYNYFDGLKPEFDLKEAHPNFQDTKAIITAYFTLNDLLLGKVVGDKEDKKEKYHLESILQDLANNTNFKVDIELLKASIDKAIPESDLESVIYDVRGLFKEQLKHLNS